MSLHVVDHPLLKHQLANLRLASTTPKEFRQHVSTISMIVGVEATKQLQTKLVQGEGPLAQFQGEEVEDRIALVPILRAGLGMVDGMFIPALPACSPLRHLSLYLYLSYSNALSSTREYSCTAHRTISREGLSAASGVLQQGEGDDVAQTSTSPC